MVASSTFSGESVVLSMVLLSTWPRPPVSSWREMAKEACPPSLLHMEPAAAGLLERCRTLGCGVANCAVLLKPDQCRVERAAWH